MPSSLEGSLMLQQAEPMIKKRNSCVKKTENQVDFPLESTSSLLHLAVTLVREAAGGTSYSQTCNTNSQFYSARIVGRGNNANLPLLNYVHLKLDYYD